MPSAGIYDSMYWHSRLPNEITVVYVNLSLNYIQSWKVWT